ncbi:hypothetical protein EVAR_23907_1 [Eumeta japonica]|uniref:Uncharacterized protein n=1 Tax=Eumeta variegata TaxID=151549 RepID=A0A4C1V137_EUMVA|nr:hypothetical protein EVAR_23907_1 [Eumeta japonica]
MPRLCGLSGVVVYWGKHSLSRSPKMGEGLSAYVAYPILECDRCACSMLHVPDVSGAGSADPLFNNDRQMLQPGGGVACCGNTCALWLPVQDYVNFGTIKLHNEKTAKIVCYSPKLQWAQTTRAVLKQKCRSSADNHRHAQTIVPEVSGEQLESKRIENILCSVIEQLRHE